MLAVVSQWSQQVLETPEDCLFSFFLKTLNFGQSCFDKIGYFIARPIDNFVPF